MSLIIKIDFFFIILTPPFCLKFNTSSKRNFIYTSFISLYTPLKILIEENTNLPLNLFFQFLSSSSSSSLSAPQLPSSSEVASFEKIVRMCENDVIK